MSGKDKVKTLPGGCCTMCMALIFWMGTFIALADMFQGANWTVMSQEKLLTQEELQQNITRVEIGNTTIAIQVESFYDKLTEDEKEEEIQKYMKLSSTPGLAWGGRRLEDDDEEDEPKPDMRPGVEVSFLNLTLDRMQLAINIQKKLGLHTENETGQIVI